MLPKRIIDQVLCLLFISFLLHFFFDFISFPSTLTIIHHVCCCCFCSASVFSNCYYLFVIDFCQFEFDMNCYGLLDSSCMWGLMKFLCIVFIILNIWETFQCLFLLKKINPSFLMITPVTC